MESHGSEEGQGVVHTRNLNFFFFFFFFFFFLIARTRSLWESSAWIISITAARLQRRIARRASFAGSWPTL